MSRRRTFARLYPHPTGRVWQGLVDRAALEEWMGPSEFEPIVGHRYVQRFYGRQVSAEVIEVVAGSRLAVRWELGGLTMTWRFELQPIAGWTRLSIEQTGLAGVRGLALGLFLRSREEPLFDRRLPAWLFRTMLAESADDRWRDRFGEAPRVVVSAGQ